MYTVTKRKHGIDLYFDGTRMDSHGMKVDDVTCSYDTMYIKLNTGVIRYVDTYHGGAIGFHKCKEYTEKDKYYWDRIFFQRMKNSCMLFNSYALVQSSLFISHAKYVSVFNVVKQKWAAHYSFESEIHKIFRMQTPDGSYSTGVILTNGQIYMKALNEKRSKQ